jgi:hypothetical protein
VVPGRAGAAVLIKTFHLRRRAMAELTRENIQMRLRAVLDGGDRWLLLAAGERGLSVLTQISRRLIARDLGPALDYGVVELTVAPTEQRDVVGVLVVPRAVLGRAALVRLLEECGGRRPDYAGPGSAVLLAGTGADTDLLIKFVAWVRRGGPAFDDDVNRN